MKKQYYEKQKKYVEKNYHCPPKYTHNIHSLLDLFVKEREKDARLLSFDDARESGK